MNVLRHDIATTYAASFLDFHVFTSPNGDVADRWLLFIIWSQKMSQDKYNSHTVKFSESHLISTSSAITLLKR